MFQLFRKKTTSAYAVICGLLILLIIVYCTNILFTQRSNYVMLEPFYDGRINKNPKHILLWDPLFNEKNWYLAPNNVKVLDYKFFEKQSCPTTNCTITWDRDLLENIYEYDAIVFNGLSFETTPQYRSPHQKYVFGILESPFNTKSDLNNAAGFFNWTMSYRLDSDIVWHYKSFVDVELNKVVAPAFEPPWRNYDNNFYDKELLDVIKNKTKKIAWFVSHCNAISRRDDLAKALQKYIDVDIYGKCGPLKCDDNKKCNSMLKKEYKFYLSFENSLCTDYVTEKLFIYLDHLIVPIVYGGADYTKFAPPHSYINTNDFDTVEDLAEYLKYLDNNPEEYMKYFWWTKHYTVEEYSKRAFCNMCMKLHRPMSSYKSEVYTNLHMWWRTCDIRNIIKF